MQMLQSFISIVRLGALAVLLAFSVIVLGVSAHILNVTVSTINFYWRFVALGVAIPALTFLTVAPAIIVSFIMGTTPIFILIESVWLGVLWVLWLATASYAADSTALLPASCDFSLYADGKTISCHEFQALQAFSWLNWLILTAYVPTVFVLSIIEQSRNKARPAVQPAQPVAYPNQQQAYPPQQQQVYAPQPVYQQPVPQQMPPQQMQQMSPQQMPQQLQASYAPGAPPAGYDASPHQASNQAPVNPGYSQV